MPAATGQRIADPADGIGIMAGNSRVGITFSAMPLKISRIELEVASVSKRLSISPIFKSHATLPGY
ncbi:MULTISPECIES: hypothetical protein [unclassified Burkholderia]|uniref:hypothetical protein n=1 Tax=unclassified Burkholderia TaxID=2613784 RepID=UPI00117C544D|nr:MULTISPECIES: hypothetical protein [unclassified Burkholderia]NIE55717.1 hypothetical protein [Burkholderia sp. Ap-955]NIF09165.1 hypothetical protein [Burkholderia sp. Ax-1735]NIG02591.1 hypothetical protein [Burkholderia sp. Tr-849]